MLFKRKFNGHINNEKTNSINQFSGSTFSLTSATRWARDKALFLVQEAGCAGVMMRRWVPQNRFTLRRNGANLTPIGLDQKLKIGLNKKIDLCKVSEAGQSTRRQL